MVATPHLGHQPRLQDRPERREGAHDHPQGREGGEGREGAHDHSQGQQVSHPAARQAQDQLRQPEGEE